MAIDIHDIDFASASLPGERFHEVAAACRGGGHVTPVTFLGREAYYIASFEALDSALRDAKHFPGENWYKISTEPVMGRSFISMPLDEQKVYRRLTTPAFRPRNLAIKSDEFYSRIINELIDVFIDSNKAELVSQLTRAFPLIMISRMLGLPVEAKPEFKTWAENLLVFLYNEKAALDASSSMAAYLKPIIAERRAAPRDDIISDLVQTETDGHRLTDEEVASHIMLLFPTGADTTFHALGNLIYTLLSHESCWKLMVQEPSSRGAAIEELLRWESPAPIIPRVSCGEPVDFFNVSIPANSYVLFGIAAANRDPSVFDDPDSFDINRKVSRILTFGPGPRNCPGMHLARKEMNVALNVLAERLPNLSLVDPVQSQPQGCILRGPRSLHVNW